MYKLVAVIGLLFFLTVSLQAQDTLPDFSVTTRGKNRVLISWVNQYPVIGQINIQRSTDSLKNYKTILAVPDPNNLQNGFVDSKAATPFMFYRLFILLDSGKYVFSPAKRPFWDTATKAETDPGAAAANASKRVIVSDSLSNSDAAKIRAELDENNKTKPKPERIYIVKRRDTILYELPEKNFRKFRDSVVYKTKDTMVFRSADTILIKPFLPKEVYKPSRYVYTEKDGNIAISLPDAGSKHFSIKFFDEKNKALFEIPRVKEASLILDKANFLRAGWYHFELYEEGKLKEKNKFFIPKDF